MWADINLTNTSSRVSGSRASHWTRQLLSRLPRGIGEGALLRFEAWRRRRAELAELAALDDRDLADLGISRGDFHAILDGTYRRDQDAFGATAQAEGRPLSYVRESGSAATPESGSQLPNVSFLFWPFTTQPSWYERYWYGATSTSERRR